jgi:hypothetical protein
MPNLGPFELLMILIIGIVPIVLASWLAARKGLEPLWVWVLLAILFGWIMLIVTLVMPSRRGDARA